MQTIKVPATQAKQILSAVVDRAVAGNRVIITRNGRPVVVMYGAEHDPSLTPEAIAALLSRAEQGESGSDSASTGLPA